MNSHHKPQHVPSSRDWPCPGPSVSERCLVSGVQTGEGHLLDHLRHGDFGIFFKGIHHEPIAADIIHTLETERILGSEPILHTGTQTHLEPSKSDLRMLRLQGHCLRKGKANTASFKFWKSSDLGGLT